MTDREGTLYFRLNDDILSDNEGFMTIELVVERGTQVRDRVSDADSREGWLSMDSWHTERSLIDDLRVPRLCAHAMSSNAIYLVPSG